MEPFQLLCPGCASKLKVSKRSAVGQRLACPKCREMILVQPPEGHDIGESIAAASFDDMDLDSILENRQPAPKKPSQQVPANVPPPRRPVASTPRPTQPQTRQPAKPPRKQELAPGEEWVNPTTKKKQRLVLMIMAAIGSLLAIAALAVFLLSGFGAGGKEVAEVPEDIKKETVENPVEDSETKVETETM